MKEPKPVDSKTARQLYFAGRIRGLLDNETVSLEELNAAFDELDPNLLQAYIDSKPVGFLYSEECKAVIELSRERARARKASN